MLKRHGSEPRDKTVLKRHRPSVELLPQDVVEPRSFLDDKILLKRHGQSVEWLPHDIVELILERLPVKFLLRFKSVSKKWKSTIESQQFKERQLIRRRQSRGPDVLFVSIGDEYDGHEETPIVLGSSIISMVRFPFSSSLICHGSCDGLLCLSGFNTPNYVVNPTTRWYQNFPPSSVQQFIIDSYNKRDYSVPLPKLGLGKDKLRDTFKPVWLYNSSEFGLDNVTTCEVFDFSTHTWRYVRPASPYRIVSYHKPVYLDGSLHWFTECQETKVLSFHLHTETFQVISKTPFAHLHQPCKINMCVLDNRLCVSELNWPTQVIWSLDKTWTKMCSIDLTKTKFWFGEPKRALLPIAILDKNKLLLQGHGYLQPRVIHDLHTKSYDVLFKPKTSGHCVYYFQSLFSVLPN